MSDERKSRKWWAVDGGGDRVVEVTGYECPPNDGIWWVPELGYSMSVGAHLFATRDEAVARLRAELRECIARATAALARLDPPTTTQTNSGEGSDGK